MTGDEIIKAVEAIKEYIETLDRSIHELMDMRNDAKENLGYARYKLEAAQKEYNKANAAVHFALKEREDLIGSIEDLRATLAPYLSN